MRWGRGGQDGLPQRSSTLHYTQSAPGLNPPKVVGPEDFFMFFFFFCDKRTHLSAHSAHVQPGSVISYGSCAQPLIQEHTRAL